MEISFDKMSAIGNDFIMIDGRVIEARLVLPHTKELCDRRFGIGGDGVIAVLSSKIADFRMQIINSDGSEAQMCGNGIRCFAHWLKERGEFTSKELTVETLAGIMRIESVGESRYRVNMGRATTDPAKIPVVGNDNSVKFSFFEDEFRGLSVSMGNPHTIFFVDTITDKQVFEYGPKIELDKVFPDKSNVEFVELESRKNVSMRVWERGCGETLACGTGACAVVVAGVLEGKLDENVTVHLRGGDLEIEWCGDLSKPVFMAGDANRIFRGVINIK